jgi:hypothetical protein
MCSEKLAELMTHWYPLPINQDFIPLLILGRSLSGSSSLSAALNLGVNVIGLAKMRLNSSIRQAADGMR